MRAKWSAWGALGLVLGALGCKGDEPVKAEVTTTASATTTAATATTAATTASAATAPAKAKPEPPKPAPPPQGMVKVPAGVFKMGGGISRDMPEEKPQHDALVAAFFMDEKEVTVDAYMACVKEGACAKPHPKGRFCNLKFDDRGNHPINCVDLKMATAYCKHVGKRLPTEREWEYAARGGAEQRRFSWGAEDPTTKNSCYDHPFGTCPVGSFAPGAFGLHDMSGNVWEWTSSYFAPYPSRFDPDPVEDGKLYAYRGGSWSRRYPRWLRTPLRNRYRPHQHHASLGIRCAKRVTPLECPAGSITKGARCLPKGPKPKCEDGKVFNGEHCVLDIGLVTSGPLAKGDGDAEKPVITRSRSPEHDADCRKHWPKYPVSYLFKGGKNFPSRQPALRAAGCAPRNMGWAWTSACCRG